MSEKDASIKRIKILFCITKGNFGGAQRYVFDLATSLPRDKFESIVACGNGGGDILPEKLLEKGIRAIKIESLEREIKANKDFKVFKNITKIIKEEKPDVVHFNSSKIGLLGSLAVLYLKFLSLVHNSKFIIHSIFTAHGWAFNEQRSLISKTIFYIGHYLTILICNATIAVSEKTKKDAKCFPFVKNKIKVVYNGISDFNLPPKEKTEKTPTNDKPNRTASAETNKIRLFSISELHKNKGIDTAFRAISMLPKEAKEKIIYSIAGDGEEKENLENLAKELKIADIVRFLGFVPEAKTLLSDTDIFLLPSRTEAFPYAILEAGMAELPIIATSVGGVPEIIRDMQNGILVHRENPKEIAEAILYLLSRQEKQKEFGQEIKKTVSNFFSLEKMISGTLEIYNLKVKNRKFKLLQ